MRMYDIIEKKRDGGELTDEEIKFFVSGVSDGSIPDYQASALLMAIFLKGMSEGETLALTIAMANSGETADLSAIKGDIADKHSTGGVGDKTSLIAAPVAAALGVKIAKMSGRGLGHTGGTLDKLESISGLSVTLSSEEFTAQVNRIGIAIIGQSKALVPADKKLYALRDVTATVNSIPLIASSIMSKKLASGAKNIVLDVKTGSGAFMKTLPESVALAEEMVKIGKGAGRNVAALITDMDKPLGNYIGNSLEIKEVIEVLKGGGAEDLKEVSFAIAANMLCLAKGIDYESASALVKSAIADGSAFNKFKEFVSAQGGDVSFIDNPEKFPKAKYLCEIKAEKSAFISNMHTQKIGICASLLGAGRTKADDEIDFSAGIVLSKKTGDFVNPGEVIATLYTNDENSLNTAKNQFLSALSYSETQPEKTNAVIKKVM